MIILLGVGHVFDIAASVRKIIQEEHPDAVGVELDPGRYQALLHPGQPSNAPLTYKILAAFQRRMAHQFGGEVGSEMLAATRTAQEIGAEILFIDADAGRLFGRLWAEMPLKEKVRLGLSGLTSMFLGRHSVERQLESFQDNEDMYLEEMSSQFPTLKRMLIDERNEVMAKRIDRAASRYPVVLIVIGDGHVDGIIRLLDRDDIKVYRLKQILGQDAGNGGGVAHQSNAQARFHFERSLQ